MRIWLVIKCDNAVWTKGEGGIVVNVILSGKICSNVLCMKEAGRVFFLSFLFLKAIL